MDEIVNIDGTEYSELDFNEEQKNSRNETWSSVVNERSDRWTAVNRLISRIGDIMFAKIFCIITAFFLLIGNAYAQEEGVALKQTSEVINSYCGVSTAMEEARKDDSKIFAGIINSHSILYLTLDKKGFWTVTIDNLSGISCIYFMGQSGIPMIDMDKKKGIGLKGNIGRMING